MSDATEGAMLLEAASELVTLTGQVALQSFRRDVDVERKADGSQVTIADRNAEQAARDWLASRFPADGVLGEELGEIEGTSGRRWMIDPIDGTAAFVRGVPLWGSMAALCEGERVLVGAISFPAVDELLVAAPGQGCWHSGSRCAVSEVSNLEDATILTTDGRFDLRPFRFSRWRELGNRSSLSRTWGDCYGYLLVATGRAEVMVDPVLNLWDAAALQPIIEEAGGVFTDWRGNHTAFGGDVIATNAALGTEVRQLLLDNATGGGADARS